MKAGGKTQFFSWTKEKFGSIKANQILYFTQSCVSVSVDFPIMGQNVSLSWNEYSVVYIGKMGECCNSKTQELGTLQKLQVRHFGYSRYSLWSFFKHFWVTSLHLVHKNNTTEMFLELSKVFRCMTYGLLKDYIPVYCIVSNYEKCSRCTVQITFSSHWFWPSLGTQPLNMKTNHFIHFL